MNTPKICNAKLLNRDAYCQQTPLPGKRRCARHGGNNTGARTPEGMAAQVRGMQAGRKRWIAKMKAEGRPLPFAGFRPKGSGLTREARAQAKAERAETRRVYSEQRAQLKTLKAKSRTIRDLLPRYIKKSDFDDPRAHAQLNQAFMLANECSNFNLGCDPATLVQKAIEGDPLAQQAVDHHLKVEVSLMRVQFDYMLEAGRRQKLQADKDRYERDRQAVLQAYREKSERDRQARLANEEEPWQPWQACVYPWQQDELTADDPAPPAATHHDCEQDHATLAPMPDFAGRVYGNRSLRR